MKHSPGKMKMYDDSGVTEKVNKIDVAFISISTVLVIVLVILGILAFVC